MEIKKKFYTETSHIVRKASSIRCRENIHGHSYEWVVTLEGRLQSNGMVLDFKDFKPIKDFIDLFDHATVFWSKEPDDEILPFFLSKFSRVLVMRQNPTAENMARLVFKFTQDWIKITYPNYGFTESYGTINLPLIKVVQVEVWETKTGCGIATECDDNDVLIYQHEDKN